MSLHDYIERLQTNGQYSFTQEEALAVLKCSEISLTHAILRLKKKNKIAVPKPNFFVIVPVEYREWGIVPANWFIDNLMKFLGRNYYVGLLTAAAQHGAAHQAPQQFQVMVEKPLRQIRNKGLTIKFFTSEQLPLIPTNKVQTPTGYMKVSTPEATVLDLVKFYSKVGYFSHVATLLAELKNSIKPELLITTFQAAHYEWPILQRIGYLFSLENIFEEHIITTIQKHIDIRKPKLTPLAPYKTHRNCLVDERFRIYINEEIEVDDL